MSDAATADGVSWLRERVWHLQAQVAASEAKIAGLESADGQHRQEIHSLRVEIAALRAEMAKQFEALTSKIDLHLGNMRAEMSALKAVAPERGETFGLPIRWLVIGGLAFVAALSAAAFGIGIAMRPTALQAAAQALTQ